jgi:hypothetical protein
MGQDRGSLAHLEPGGNRPAIPGWPRRRCLRLRVGLRQRDLAGAVSRGRLVVLDPSALTSAFAVLGAELPWHGLTARPTRVSPPERDGRHGDGGELVTVFVPGKQGSGRVEEVALSRRRDIEGVAAIRGKANRDCRAVGVGELERHGALHVDLATDPQHFREVRAGSGETAGTSTVATSWPSKASATRVKSESWTEARCAAGTSNRKNPCSPSGIGSFAPSGYRIAADTAPPVFTRPPIVTGDVCVTGSVKGIVTSIGSSPSWAAVVQTAPLAIPEVTISAQ